MPVDKQCTSVGGGGLPERLANRDQPGRSARALLRGSSLGLRPRVQMFAAVGEGVEYVICKTPMTTRRSRF